MPPEPQNPSPISQRKSDHVRFALADSSQSAVSAGWDDIVLLHRALPEIDVADIDLTTSILGRRFLAPVLITGMTGGFSDAAAINQRLGRAAEKFGLPMGLGSQRVQLVAPESLASFRAARDAAPSAFLIANIGAAQLVHQPGRQPLTVSDLRAIIASVEANALAIHLNPLQEMVQPGGDRAARGMLDAIRNVCAALSLPVMVKETGAGISREVAAQLAAAGVHAIDVGGLGGTNMARIESSRAAEAAESGLARLGETFADWGIPTAVSVAETVTAGVPVVATGGVRSGLDVAKALCLGATMAGLGRPLLGAAIAGEDALAAAIETLLNELRAACFLTGSARVADLSAADRVVFGRTGEWLRQRGVVHEARPARQSTMR